MFSLRLLMSSSKKPRPYCILAQHPPTRPPPPDAGGSIVAFLLGRTPLMRRNGRFGGLGLRGSCCYWPRSVWHRQQLRVEMRRALV